VPRDRAVGSSSGLSRRRRVDEAAMPVPPRSQPRSPTRSVRGPAPSPARRDPRPGTVSAAAARPGCGPHRREDRVVVTAWPDGWGRTAGPRQSVAQSGRFNDLRRRTAAAVPLSPAATGAKVQTSAGRTARLPITAVRPAAGDARGPARRVAYKRGYSHVHDPHDEGSL
jgi:hypothetical protein